MARDLAFAGWLVVALALALFLGAVALAVRLLAIRRPGGAVECSLRRDTDERWRRGVAVYETDRLCWFRSYGVGLRPDAVFDRQALRLVARQPPQPEPAASEPALGGAVPGQAVPGQAADPRVRDLGTTVVRFETGAPGEALWLALSTDALTGLLAWLEAAPRHWFDGLC